jgi:hypothetical protein
MNRSLFSPLRLVCLLLLGIAGTTAFSLRDEAGVYLKRLVAGESRLFKARAFVPGTIPQIFDLGVVDADGDGHLDLYTSNHNYRQLLLLSDGRGGHRDVLTPWGLDQNPAFPGWEQSFTRPRIERPGLYVYWLGENLVLQTHGLREIGPVSGKLAMFSEIGIAKNKGFQVAQTRVNAPDSPIAETVIEFGATADGKLELVPPSRGVPTLIEFAEGFPLSHVYIGNQGVSPASRQVSPYLQDRHGHAWADINGDGKLDVFITRGGVGGTLRDLPGAIRQGIRDELLVSGNAERFQEVATQAGIEKKDCSGRHAEWADVNGDGRLELFVNCQDRGKSHGIFAKQLWVQGPEGHFSDVAMDIGLGLPGHEIIDFAWMDADDDGDLDMLTTEDKGFFLYRGEDGKFSEQLLFRPEFVRADVAGLRGEVSNYWRFDGKITVADFDSDGDPDAFASSKRGNELLVNDRGEFRRVAPKSLGLPEHALNATWVDYDNDGLQDLHVVPDGIYRQVTKGVFEATGLLAVAPHRYQAAIVHWYDQDNDGDRDVLMALNDNPTLWRWWQKPFKMTDDEFEWTLSNWSNAASRNLWLQVAVEGGAGNPQAVGARVTVFTEVGGQTLEVGSNDSAFFSQGHYRLYFGLGESSRAERITVRWTDGKTLELQDVAGDQLIRIAPDVSPE